MAEESLEFRPAPTYEVNSSGYIENTMGVVIPDAMYVRTNLNTTLSGAKFLKRNGLSGIDLLSISRSSTKSPEWHGTKFLSGYSPDDESTETWHVVAQLNYNKQQTMWGINLLFRRTSAGNNFVTRFKSTIPGRKFAEFVGFSKILKITLDPLQPPSVRYLNNDPDNLVKYGNTNEPFSLEIEVGSYDAFEFRRPTQPYNYELSPQNLPNGN